MAEDTTLMAYKASLAMEPIARLNYFVHIIANTGDYYRKVSYYEAIPPFQITDLCQNTPRGPLQTATPLTTGQFSSKLTITQYGLWKGEFGQWRWFPLDDAQIQLFVPAGNSKWSLKNLQVGLARDIIYRDPLLVSTEFNTWEEEWPALQALNFSGYTLNACRIITWGYRFHTDPIVEAPQGQPLGTQTPGGIANAPFGTQAAIKAGTIPCTNVFCKAQAGSGN